MTWSQAQPGDVLIDGWEGGGVWLVLSVRPAGKLVAVRFANLQTGEVDADAYKARDPATLLRGMRLLGA
jgi:hypothetical protein